MHYPTVAIQTVVAIENGDGSAASGIAANVNAAVYDESDNFVANIVVAEIGATGMYQGSFTPDAVGTWKVLWTCTSPVARMLKTYFVVTDQLTDILADTNEIQGKLPTNNIMGSSDKDDHDIDIDNILIIVTDIDTDLGEPGDAVGTGTVHGKLGSTAEFAGHDSIKVELIDIAAALGGSCDITGS